MRWAGLLLAGSLWAQVDYQREVHPILAAKCGSCHSQEKRSGGLSLGTLTTCSTGARSGAAVKPGNGASSLLMRRVDGEIAAADADWPVRRCRTASWRPFATWIDQGARATPTSVRREGPVGGSARAEAARRLPPVVWKEWHAPVDRFVAAYLARGGMKEPEFVSDALFARRV